MEHTRVHFITADPARFGDLVGLIDATTRPAVEDQPGNLGLSVQVDDEVGVAIVESHWVSGDALRENEKSVDAATQDVVRRCEGTLSIENYEVASFVQNRRPSSAAAVQLTRSDVNAVSIDEAIANYEDVAVPWLTSTEGFCRSVLMVHRRMRRSITETVWVDAGALAARRSALASVRADIVAATDVAIRALEEYRLVASSARTNGRV